MAARKRGFDLSGQRARQAKAAEFKRFDYVLAMDSDNHHDLSGLCPAGEEHRLHMFLDFAPEVGKRDVPDPYYGEGGGFVPCTPGGVHELLIRSGVTIEGAEVVILGRGNIVGKPMAAILCQKARHANTTVTLCHSRTHDVAEHCRRADIIVAAMGVAEFVKADMVKPGATVIDVGVNQVDDPAAEKGYRLVGDVDFAAVQPIAGKITPNPGGVGPMTIAMLMRNTVRAAEQQTDEGAR